MNAKILYLLPVIIMSFFMASCSNKTCEDGCKWDTGFVTLQATCEVNGEIKYTCINCDNTKIETLKPMGHKIVIDNEIVPSCYKSGLTEGSHCENCGKVYLKQQEIAKVDHDWKVKSIVKEKTCTTDGIQEFQCTFCNTSKYIYIKAEGHNVIIDESVAARCDKTGLTEGSHCSICNDILIKQEIINKLEQHTLENDRCITCDYLNPEAYGLEYVLSYDNNCYNVAGIGEATSDKIYILDEYKGLPVKSIFLGSFMDCNNIESIFIPKGITSIESFAFQCCSSLVSIVIPESVTYLGEWLFSGCDSLTIYCEVTSKPSGWDFEWSSSRPVYWGINETNFYEENGIQYVLDLETKEATIARYIGNDSEVIINSTIIVNNEVYTISSIGDYAFSNCENLTSIIIPNSVTSLGSNVFSRCTNLISIELPNNIAKIGSYTFFYCTSLENITIPSSVTSIGESAFSNCSRLKSIEIANSIISISAQAFFNCSSLTIYCEALSKPSGWNYNWNSSNRPVYWEFNKSNFCEENEIQYFINFETKEATVTRYIGNDSDIVLGNTVKINNDEYTITSIGNYAFYKCTGLTSITIPISITHIGSLAFSDCSSSIIYCEATSKHSGWEYGWDNNKQVYWGINESKIYEENGIQYVLSLETMSATIANYVGNDSDFVIKNEIIVNDKVYTITSIGNYVFSNSINLENVYYDGTITDWFNIKLGTKFSSQMYNIEQFYLKNFNNEYYSISSITEIEIPNTIVKLNDYQCFYFENVVNVIIPNSIKNIGSNAFKDCNSLENVYYNGTLEDWCNIEFENKFSNPMYYADHFFMLDYNNDYYEVTEIEIPIDIHIIGNYQFFGFNNLKNIEMHENVFRIGNYAFDYTGLRSVTIPSNVSSIGDYAFQIELENLYYNGTLEEWCEIYFSSMYATPMWYAEHFFMLDSNNEYYEVKEIEIPNSQTAIHAYQFSNFDNITKVIIPNSVTSIDSHAFSYCENLKSIIIPNSVTKIRNDAFRESNNLIIYCEAISKPSEWNDNWNSDRYVYWGINETNFYEENGIQYVLDLEIKEATIARYIGNDSEVIINSTIVVNNEVYTISSIGDYAFSNCIRLSKIEIPNSVIRIGNNAFSNCESLKKIVIPNSVKNIGQKVFYECNDLVIYCEASSEPIGWNTNWNLFENLVFWNYVQNEE